MESTGLKKIFLMEGLSCADCASKIEEKINRLEGVKEAKVNFATMKFTLITDKKAEFTVILKESLKIMDRIEPGMVIKGDYPEQAGGKRKEQKSTLTEMRNNRIRLGVGGVIFASAFLMGDQSIFRFLLFGGSYLIVGGGILLRAGKNILRGQVFDENFLMSVATIGAFLIGEYPEGVAVMLFYRVGEYFQNLAVNRSRKSISDLMDIRPDFARVNREGKQIEVFPENVVIGETIMIKPGEKVALDGKVLEGQSSMDTSALTGESMPRDVNENDEVLSGFINTGGLLLVEVTKNFGDSTVSKILDLVENAGNRKAPTENFITKFAKYYTPIVVFTALGLAIIPPLMIEGASFNDWIYRALVFLVISCPCALVISIPLGFFGGIGGASSRGVLIKGSNFLEALNQVDTVVFDKTGTLTKGKFSVIDIAPSEGVSKDELMKYGAHGEYYSNHPIAKSIMEAFRGTIQENQIQNLIEIPGNGIKVLYRGKKLLLGSEKWMESHNIRYQKSDTPGTLVHVAYNNEYKGCLEVADEIKDDAKAGITQLKALGIKNIILLTGDRRKVGEKIAGILGIDEVYCELLPQDKVIKLEEIQERKGSKSTRKKVLYVGDGINDAPVLARADVGVAMGGLGSDAAIEAADVVIMNDEPSKLVEAIKVARRTRGIVWQNIIIAMGVKMIFLILGAMGIASLWEAVFADVGVAVIAILNAMRVMKGE